MSATAQLPTLSLHDALPISRRTNSPALMTRALAPLANGVPRTAAACSLVKTGSWRKTAKGNTATLQKFVKPIEDGSRSEEHTSELQSRENLVCRLLLEKKNI